MNSPHTSDMPGELMELSALLDRLGEADRRSAAAGVEARVAAGSAAALSIEASAGAATDVLALQEHVGELAQRERERGRAGLEDRVFAASVAELVPALAGRLHEPQRVAARSSGLAEPGRRPSVGMPWWRSRSVHRLAAAVFFAGVIGAGLWFGSLGRSAGRDDGPDVLASGKLPSTMSTDELKASLNDDFAVLLAAAEELESTTGGRDQASSAEWGEDTELPQSWFDELEALKSARPGGAS
jgi:hypothetical protein